MIFSYCHHYILPSLHYHHYIIIPIWMVTLLLFNIAMEAMTHL